MPFDLASFIVLLTVGLLTPGPDMIIVLKNSLGGRARGMATVAGITLGLGLQTALLAAAFTLLTDYTATIAGALRWIGAFVLVCFGLRALLSRAAVSAPPTEDSPPPRTSSAFTEGLLCNLTNPKAFLFFTGVLSQLIGPASPRWLAIALPVIVMVHGALCWGAISFTVQSGQIAGRLRRAQATLVKVFGGLLVLFGLGLVLWRP